MQTISGSALLTSAIRPISPCICTGECPTNHIFVASKRSSNATMVVHIGARCTREPPQNSAHSIHAGKISNAFGPTSIRKACFSMAICVPCSRSIRQKFPLPAKIHPHKENVYERCHILFLARNNTYRILAAQCTWLAPRHRDLGGGHVARRLYIFQHHSPGRAGRSCCPAVLYHWLCTGAAGRQPVQRVLT